MRFSLRRIREVEYILLTLLWLCSLTTLAYGAFNSYYLSIQGWLGLIGLSVVTTYLYFRPHRATDAVLWLLFLGSGNLIAFTFVFNFFLSGSASFGANTPSSPFIELITPDLNPIVLLMMLTLMVIRRKRVKEIWLFLLSKTDRDEQENLESTKTDFKKRYSSKSTAEIERHLQNKLRPEVKEALLELLDERKAPEQHNKA